MRDAVEEFYSTCKPEDDLTDPRAELARMRAERDNESRWATQYKDERDAAIETLKAALALITQHHDCSKRIELGALCPHCTDADGNAPVLDRIYRMIGITGGAGKEFAP